VGGSKSSAPASIVSVRIVPRGAAFSADMLFSGAVSGTRQLSGERCASLADAVILIVAITIDPLAVADHVSLTPPSASSPGPALHGEFALTALADVGSLPQPSFGPGAQIGISLQRFHAELGAAWWVPRVRLRGPRAGTGGEFGLWEGALRAGLDVLQSRALALGPTAAFSLGSSTGAAWKIDNPNAVQHAPWAATLLGARFCQRADPLFVEIGAELGFLIVQPDYGIEDFGTVFKPARWFGRFRLGIGWTVF
jgi:hypothetical protein